MSNEQQTVPSLARELAYVALRATPHPPWPAGASFQRLMSPAEPAAPYKMSNYTALPPTSRSLTLVTPEPALILDALPAFIIARRQPAMLPPISVILTSLRSEEPVLTLDELAALIIERRQKSVGPECRRPAWVQRVKSNPNGAP